MDSAAAERLCEQIENDQEMVCLRVSRRLLQTFPELKTILNLEGGISPEERLIAVAVQRLCKLTQVVLTFEMLTLADQEIAWAVGVLPRYGVTSNHMQTMVRCYFEELSHQPLAAAEQHLAHTIEAHMLSIIQACYEA